MNTNFQVQYDQAKKHKDEHVENKRRCGGEPYKNYNELFQLVRDFSIQKKQAIKVLEIGTAVGFTTFVIQTALLNEFKDNHIDTIEHHKVHIELARHNILEWGGDVSQINFLEGEALDILQNLHDNSYDIIFFDGYGAKLFFQKEFERLLKKGGALITANAFLKTTEQKYFDELNEKKGWVFLKEFSDTKVHIKNF